MNLDQKIAIIYSLLGIASGFVSNFLIGWIPFIIYLASLPLLLRLERKKKFLWLFFNSFVTFLLVWILVWIILFNMW
jgi:hypothetical protein